MHDLTPTAVPDTAAQLPDTPRKPDDNRHFVFVHRVFAAPGAVFKLDANTGEPVLALDLGNVKACLPFPALIKAFEIAPDSPDSRQLDAVAKGLRHVRRIAPGDSIPAELLDGSASWKVEAHHAAAARGKLFAGLLAALGKRPNAKTPRDYAVLAENASLLPELADGYKLLAGKMGLDAKLAGDAEAIVEALAEEFAYIEALRERVGSTRALVDTLRNLRDAYRRDRSTLDQIARIVQLLERPIAAYERRLHRLDLKIADTIDAVLNMTQRIALAREVRDRLHAETMRWDDLLALWNGGVSARGQRARIDETYRFAARHFPIASDWNAA
ncbi:MAG: hypothetical protein J0H39_01330 [Alphaproteobacteria bacterium]|nr:hypothetical protein [Alphaproteobacteria bacterium]